ncbi:MAG: hypothetical protein WBC01_11120 [Solirubrobacterales bacterium]
MLRRFNLNTRNKRLALIARHAEPYERKPRMGGRWGPDRSRLLPAARRLAEPITAAIG